MDQRPRPQILCVDDEPLELEGLQMVLRPDYDVHIAPGPEQAFAKLRELGELAVVISDMQMPRMDGLDFLERLMRLRPMPVIMVSSLTERNSEVTLRALELGAVDFVTKPKLGLRDGLLEYTDLIADKIRAAAHSRPRQSPSVRD